MTSSYSEAKVYRLVAAGTVDVYIGTTCSSLEKRLYQHNFAVANPQTTRQCTACKLYEGGRAVSIELVENFPCANKQELNVRERWWIENTPNCINKNIPGQTWKERAVKRDPEIKEYMTIYRAMLFECECGATVSRAEKARHERSKKHQTHVKIKSQHTIE